MENIITHYVLQNKRIFFNGLYLSLKNLESIQSMLEIFFSKQSPWQLNTFAAADEKLKHPPKKSQEKLRPV